MKSNRYSGQVGYFLTAATVAFAVFVFSQTACNSRSDSEKPAKKAPESQQQLSARQERLNVVCWNVLYGFNHGKEKIAGPQWIADQTPHVVALQELNGISKDGLRELATKWGHNHSVILKEQGFPVGLTSNSPIEVIHKQVDGFHHGYLHCKTQGIHFVVVHFWPGKEHEAVRIMERIKPLLESGQDVVIAGDFNSNSRFDGEYLSQRTKVTPRYENVDLFESNGFVDLTHKHSPKAMYSCPSPITIPKWSADLAGIQAKRQRIDFIFASQGLAEQSVSATIVHSKEAEAISDHYPVKASFRRPMPTN